MTDPKTTTPAPTPPGLAGAGTALWVRLAATFDLAEHEAALLETCCHQADDVAALEALIAEQGLTVAGSAGQPRLNPAVPEVRQGRLALGKLLGQLALPDEDDRPMTASSRIAQRAANVRWDRRRHEQARAEERAADGTA